MAYEEREITIASQMRPPMMKSAPKMLTFESVFAERWKICDIALESPRTTAKRMPFQVRREEGPVVRTAVDVFPACSLALYHRCEK